MQHGCEKVPIKRLDRRISSFFCSQGEAAKLFYGEDRGTSRSAGLMINRFVEKQLVRRELFNGSTTRISLYIPEDFELPDGEKGDEVFADSFDPRNDIPSTAKFLQGILHQFST